MHVQLSQHDWLQLPQDTRAKLKEIFAVPKSTGVVTVSNVVQTDGHTYADLGHITIEKMAAYLELEQFDDDFPKLFQAVLDKLDKDTVVVLPDRQVDPTAVLLEEWAGTLIGLRAKAMGVGLLNHLNEVVRKVFDLNKPLNTNNVQQAEAKQGKTQGGRGRGRPSKGAGKG